MRIGFFGVTVESDTLALSQASNSASGVGVKLTYGNNPGAAVPDGTSVKINEASNSPILKRVTGASADTAEAINFNAQYVQTDATVGAGTANSMVTFASGIISLGRRYSKVTVILAVAEKRPQLRRSRQPEQPCRIGAREGRSRCQLKVNRSIHLNKGMHAGVWRDGNAEPLSGCGKIMALSCIVLVVLNVASIASVPQSLPLPCLTRP